MTDPLTDDIRQSLKAAGDRIDVTPPPFADLGTSRLTARPVRGRWVWPVTAAAAVVAVVAVVVAFVIPSVAEHRLAVAATTVTITGGIGDVGGVRFPLPQGWTVAVTDSSDGAVTACAAVTPSVECDGVEFRIAVPDREGSAPPLDYSTTFEPQCVRPSTTTIRLDDTYSALGGRAAHHYWSYCGSAGPEEHMWQLDDMTLEITTARGSWLFEGSAITAGLDLSSWPVSPGSQMVYVTSATS